MKLKVVFEMLSSKCCFLYGLQSCGREGVYMIEKHSERDFAYLPNGFWEDEQYIELSTYAKVLYALLLTKWLKENKNNDVEKPITFLITDVMSYLKCSKSRAIKTFNELEEWKLIKRVYQVGFKRPSLIYVKDVFNIERVV